MVFKLLFSHGILWSSCAYICIYHRKMECSGSSPHVLALFSLLWGNSYWGVLGFWGGQCESYFISFFLNALPSLGPGLCRPITFWNSIPDMECWASGNTYTVFPENILLVWREFSPSENFEKRRKKWEELRRPFTFLLHAPLWLFQTEHHVCDQELVESGILNSPNTTLHHPSM